MEWFNARIEQRPTLSAVAAAVHVSPAHLRRQFRLVFGKAPHAVFTRLRLEKAAQLLATTTAKLDVIARQTGFSSASDFCRVFHRCFKVYPNVWRTYLSGIEQNDRDLQLQRLLARTGTASLRSTPDETSGGSEEEAVAHAAAPAAPAPRKRASA